MVLGTPVYDVVGYAQDGELYCLDCFVGDPEAEGVSPVLVADCEEEDAICNDCGDSLC